MNDPNAQLAKQGQCECTLPFSLHLTVMILGIVGFILGVVVAIIFWVVGIWALITAILVFASGLQGLLMKSESKCYTCHIVLAVINLVNLGVLGVACIILFPFGIIWVVAVFAMELWVTIVRHCCKNDGQAGVASTELPVARPNVHIVHVKQGQPMPPTYVVDPHGGQLQEDYKQPFGGSIEGVHPICKLVNGADRHLMILVCL